MALISMSLACTTTVTIAAPPDTHPPSPALAGRQLDTVILGDSFAAGRGNGLYNPSAPISCTQSSESWGEKLVRTLHTTDQVSGTLTNVSCSGATTIGVLERQVLAVTSQTDLVLLQIGGNDIGVSELFFNCIVSCDPAAELAKARRILPDVSERIGKIIDIIHGVAPSATILIADYPDLVGDPTPWGSGKCLGFITAEMARALRSIVDSGVRMYSRFALRPNVLTVSERKVLRGHNWCDTAEPWISGLTHFERDGTKRDLGSIFAFHPLDAAHQAIATEARQKLILGFGGQRQTSYS